MTRRVVQVIGVVTGLLMLAPLTWWLTEQLPDEFEGRDTGFADYLWEPPDLSDGDRRTIAIGSAVAVAAGAFVLIEGLRSGTIRRRWVGVVVPLAALSTYAGLTYSVATAPVTGANIGGGLLLLIGYALVPVLGGTAIVRTGMLLFAGDRLRETHRL